MGPIEAAGRARYNHQLELISAARKKAQTGETLTISKPDRTWHDLSLDAVRDTLKRTLPINLLSALAEFGLRYTVLQMDQTFINASPRLAALEIDVDAWPIPPAALYVVEERQILLRATDAMVIIHETGHAYDALLGGGTYLSQRSEWMQEQFRNATSFVSFYAASAIDEWFAEGFRAYYNVNSARSPWAPVSREKLRACAPGLHAYFESALGE